MSEEHDHGFAAHAAEEVFDVSKAIFQDLFGIIFSGELDFFTKLISFIVIVSFLIEFIYLILPVSLRKQVDILDYNEKKNQSFTNTTVIAVVSLGILIVNMCQKYSLAPKSFEEKMAESRIEKEFRHR